MAKLGKQPALLVLAVAAFAAAIWIFVHNRPQTGTGDTDIKQSVLCAQCGYFAETSLGAVMQKDADGGGLPAMCPADGPGLKCPQCSQRTLYLNPIVCVKCGKKFLLTRDSQGEHVVKCPGCGWER